MLNLLRMETAVLTLCPDCAVGVAARRLVLADDVVFNASATVAPFLIIGLIALWAERIGRPRER